MIKWVENKYCEMIGSYLDSDKATITIKFSDVINISSHSPGQPSDIIVIERDKAAEIGRKLIEFGEKGYINAD